MSFLIHTHRTTAARNVYLDGSASGTSNANIHTEKDLGQLVALGFGVAAFTPAPYRRPRLGRPSMKELSSRGRLRA